MKYQDPQQADSIMKIQKELDETKIVLHKTIESVLQRGEKIDDLVAKSDGLSAQSKMFYSKCLASIKAIDAYKISVVDRVLIFLLSASEEAELVLRAHVNRLLCSVSTDWLRIYMAPGVSSNLRSGIYQREQVAKRTESGYVRQSDINSPSRD